MGRIVIGVDPHIKKPYAIAERTDDGISVYKSNSLSGIFGRWEALTKTHTLRVFIEDQFFKRNKKTLRDLARSSGRIEAICRILGLEYSFILPGTWQKALKLEGKDYSLSAYKMEEKHIAMLIKEAQKLTAHPVTDDDYASAVLIAEYGYRHLKDS